MKCAAYIPVSGQKENDEFYDYLVMHLPSHDGRKFIGRSSKKIEQFKNKRAFRRGYSIVSKNKKTRSSNFKNREVQKS